MSAAKCRTPQGCFGNFSLSSGTARERGLRRHTEKYLAWGWWTTMAEVDCSVGVELVFLGEGDADLVGAEQRQDLLLVGEVGAGGSRRSGPTSISNSHSWCIGRSPRCGSARLDRISGIALDRQGAAADR